MHIRNVIDGDLTTYWEAFPVSQQPHNAVLFPSAAVATTPGDALRFTLRFGAYALHNLGHFRLSVTSDLANLEAAESRYAALKATDPWAKLAAGYALNGRRTESVQFFAKALQQADGSEGRKPILELAARFDDVLSALVQESPDDAQLQLALARKHAQRGRRALADKEPAKAVTDLQKSRDLFARLSTSAPQWTVLTPVEMKSETGAQMELQSDGSVFVHQPPMAKNDTYSVVLQSDLPGIRGLRLEALADSRLPKGGPGTKDNYGNFVLSKLTLQVDSSVGRDQLRTLALRNASADFTENGFKIQNVITGNNPGWAISPELNKDHAAVFELAEQVDDGQPLHLVVQLHHQWPLDSGYNLGRFRLSITNDATTLWAAIIRNELKDGEIANAHAALAQAQAQSGQTGDAVASFTEALSLTADRIDKARIIAEAAALGTPGSDQSALDDAGRAMLRRQALEWMTSELSAWSKLLESGTPQERLSVMQALALWNENTDLASLRNQSATGAALPEPEQKLFARVWTDAAALLSRAETGFRALPAAEQVEAVRAELKQRNPGKDAPIEHAVENGRVVQVTVKAPGLRDLSPIRALSGLQRLHLSGDEVTDLSPLRGMGLTQVWLYSTKVSDLSPLQGMKLRHLDITTAPKLSDLSPLQGMPLENLTIAYSQVADLTPLKDMKLSYLNCDTSQVTDLSPLQNVPLTTLLIHNTKVTDLSPLRGVPLTTLVMLNSRVSDLSPLQGMPIANLQLQGSPVTDLSPLVDLPLKELQCTFEPPRDARVLRSITSLQKINTKPAAEFWKETDRPLAQRFPAVLRGDDKPANNAERLDFARIAFDEKHFAIAARLWAEALESDPQSGDDRLTQIRYQAARAAVHAAAGEGKDEPPLDDAAKAKLRRQALAWLEAELATWEKVLESDSPADRVRVVRILAGWRQERDLAGFRDGDALARLPGADRKGWRALWANVETATDTARSRAREAYERLLEAEPSNAVAATQLVDFLLPPGAQWTVLTPAEMRAESGTKLEAQDDGSVFVQKQNPARADTYTLVLPTELKGIRGLRLEALADSRLPGGGPGWAGGNFVLNAMTLHVAPAGSPDQPRAVTLRHPVADFSQAGWYVRGLTDGDAGTGWAISPQGNTDHAAVVELAEPVGDGGPLNLTVRLVHQHGDPNYTLGRFRLSVTADPLTLERDSKHLAAMNIADPWIRLATAYAQCGQNDAAGRFFGQALTSADSWAARKAILEQVAPYDELLIPLGKLHPDDPQVQLALARSLSVRGQTALAAQRTAEALAPLQQASEIFTRLLPPSAAWRVPKPVDMKAASGAKLELQPDGSVFVSSQTPPKADLYTLVFPADVPGITGLRLEALADPRLPNGGSGWAGEGNFVLSELVLQAASLDQPGRARSLALRNATADHSQIGYDVGSAIDGNGGTGWAIAPQIRKDHTAVFELAEPLGDDPAPQLTVQLGFQFGDPSYKLGRFRFAFAHDKARLQATRIRQELAANEISDLYVALARAYAQQGQSDDLLAALTQSLELTEDRADRFSLIVAAAEFAGVLEKLAERTANDVPFQADLARYYYEQGETAKGNAVREKARTRLEVQLENEPQNTLLAAELAELLLIASHWSILKPTEMKSEKGATLTFHSDGSILASGTNPELDAYTITAKPGVTDIVALRLEALPDPSLANSGPGRQGNFVLTELEVFQQEELARISGATQTFAQEVGFTAARAVDRNHGTGWAIWPKTGQAHSAYFQFEAPMHLADTQTLRVNLHFGSDVRHTLGRFRLSVCNNSAAFGREQQRLAATQVTDPWVKLAAAYVLAGDAQRATDLLARSAEKIDIAALVESGGQTGEVLDSLQARHADSYGALLPKLALTAGERGKLELARDLYARLVKLQPENELWKERADQFRTGAIAVWNFDTELAPWGSNSDCQLAVQNGVLTARTTGGDPFMVTSASGPAGGKAVVLRYRTDEPFTMEVYWGDSTGGADETRKKQYPIPASAGEWREITLPFWCHGPLNTLRLDPNTAKEHPLEIDSIVLRQLEPAEAWESAPDYSTRNAMIDAISRNDNELLALVRLHPDEPQLQLALARNLSARGQAALAGDTPAEALPLLKQALEAFSRVATGPQWTVLTPTELKSADGETLTVEDDGSIFVSGPNPDRAVYTLKLKTELPSITAIRLETIPDKRLPQGGAGRDPINGNFHVSELTAAIASGIADVQSAPINISTAIADTHTDDGSRVIRLLDRNPETRWDTYPKMIERHWAVLGLEAPAQIAGRDLSVNLDSGISPYPKHGLGHFRLSVTGDADALVRTAILADLQQKEIADLHLALGKAQTLQGEISEAVTTFAEAVNIVTDRAGKARIIAAAAPLPGMLDKLAERAVGNAQFQAELARHFADQGDMRQATAAAAKARALFEEQLANEPENSPLATELAQLLLNVSEGGGTTRWTVLQPTQMNSEKGATLSRQDDGSVLASGTNALGDVYTLQAVIPDGRIAAVRLEALPDPSLPAKGPGRHSSGNFQLSALRLYAPAKETTGQRVAIPLESHWASFAYKADDVDVAGVVDASLNKVWHVWGRFGEAHQALFLVKEMAAVSKARPIVIELHHKDIGEAVNLGRFRLSVSSDPASVDREQNRSVSMQSADPWQKLATAYRAIGDQPALDNLLERHPIAATGIADLYAADKNWEQAIAIYSKVITDATVDAVLLAKRAAAYSGAGNWDLAQADWRRIVAQQPDQAQAALDVFQKAERWNAAAEFGLQFVQQKRESVSEDTLVWLRVAPVVALADDQAAYVSYCDRMARHFAGSDSSEVFERIIKAALLRPNSIDIAKLPGDHLARILDDGTAPEGLLPWAWCSRALWAYRSGDAESAAKFVAKSEEHQPSEVAHTLNLNILALAQIRLERLDEARQTLMQAEQAIQLLQADPAKRDHDLLIAQILFREAQARIEGKGKDRP
ncbi:MAG: hypothetical protein ACKV0T_16565 [Planctomycetales bacterium]